MLAARTGDGAQPLARASRFRKASARRIGRALAVLWLSAAIAAAFAVAADLVVLRDGSEMTGTVISVDSHRVVLERDGGRRTTIPRREVARIEFGVEPPAPLRVTVSVREADDRLELLLDGRPVAPYEELRAGRVDIGPRLDDGAHLLEAVVINEDGPWSYSWTVDLGERRISLACGRRGRASCVKPGHGAQDTGRLPGGKVWLYVDRDAGTVEAQVEER